MIKTYVISILLLFLFIKAIAQEQLKHEKKVYIGPDQKIYVNKNLPIYIKISASPDENAPSYQLISNETSEYANPMYFDTEGRNTLQHPWAVDPKTKQYVEPKEKVIFEVYADGLPPTTKIKLINANRFIKNETVYYGPGLKINFESSDITSGVEATYISVNKSVYQNATSLNELFNEEKEYSIAYYSVDNVGNVEAPKFEKFHIDITPPITSYEIIGERKGNILSSKAFIKLTSKDSLSGVNRIICSINEGNEEMYKSPIPLSVLKDGKSKIQFYAIDNVGNKEEAKVITTSTEQTGINTDASAFSYYIDKEPPVISFEIIGDQYKGKYLYISGRSQFKINATDDKSGVEKIMYSINNGLLNEKYSEPFTIPNEGINTIIYTASDNVGNLALAQTQQVIVDKTSPSSKILFSGKQFTSHDTTFITRDTRIVISTIETGSGIQSINYSIDDSSTAIYKSPFTVEKDGFHTMEYQVKDNVNNAEEKKKCSFFVDNIAPEIYYHFSVKAIGEKKVREDKYDIYPSNTMLYIAATDNASGGEKIEYRINGKKEVQTIIPVKGFVPGNYEIEIVAYDVLKNKSTKTIRFAIEE
jgi:hypothetical protein